LAPAVPFFKEKKRYLAARPRYTALSLFCGCGGLDLGAERAGFDVLGAYDHDEDAVASYNANLSGKATCAEVEGLGKKALPRVNLLLGGPPCQGFSTAGAKKENDPRNRLWEFYVHTLASVEPEVFLLENVLGFQAHEAEFRRTVAEATKGAYLVEFRKLNAQLYGVPQHRYRLFAMGVRRDFSASVPWPKTLVRDEWGYRKRIPGLITMREAIEDLGPPRLLGRRDEISDGSDHVSLMLERNHEQIARHIPNGGSLKDIPANRLPRPYRGRPRDGDPGWFWYYRKPDPTLPGRTVLATLTPTFATALAPDVEYKRIGRRWVWSAVEAAPHTDTRGLYSSPVEQRRLSVRECARLQTFPDWFEWVGSAISRHRQIGNAVPCDLGLRLCEAIRSSLDGTEYSIEPSQLTLPIG
jgi:DNA (cytosine-5)-methyltransferase 1